jgi:hypothetical protein
MLLRNNEKYRKTFTMPFDGIDNKQCRWGDGGGDQTPAPQAPSIGQATSESSEAQMQSWLKHYPQIFAMQQQMAPQEAAQQVSMAQQYAQPLAQAFKSAQETMYPQETAMTAELNRQAMEGMQSEVPDWMRQEYLSNLNANLGTNVGSPIGADYASRGLMQQKQDWQNYYRNMGLSITGRQPITTAQAPQYTNQMQGYTPQSVGSLGANVYGTQAGMYGNQLSNYTSMQQYNPWMNVAGSLAGGVGSGIGTGLGYAAMAGMM